VEILQLKRQPQETCRTLKAQVERLSRETGLLSELEQARKSVSALEAPLRAQVEPVLWGQSPGGIYMLDQAFEVAERIDLARVLLEGVLAEGRRQTGGAPKEVSAMAVTPGPAATVGCYRCGAHAHRAHECRIGQDVVCIGCGKTGHMEAVCWSKDGGRRPEWAGCRGGAGAGGKPGQVTLQSLQAQMAQLTKQQAELTAKAPGASTATGDGPTLLAMGANVVDPEEPKWSPYMAW
jgi:hypothetical protein